MCLVGFQASSQHRHHGGSVGLVSLVSQFSHSVVFDSLWPPGLRHARLPCPSPTPGVYSNSCPSSCWCHPAISSSVIPFSSCPQSLPASGSFLVSQFFLSAGQSIGASASASVPPVNSQDWSPLGWTAWISLQSKGLSRVFSNTTVHKHKFPCIRGQTVSENNFQEAWGLSASKSCNENEMVADDVPFGTSPELYWSHVYTFISVVNKLHLWEKSHL